MKMVVSGAIAMVKASRKFAGLVFLVAFLGHIFPGCTPADGDSPADADNDGVAAPEDCDDEDPGIKPGAAEICDGLDNNCNDTVDENLSFTYYADQDGDRFGDPGAPVEGCVVTAGFAQNALDCDDADSSINPNASEECNGLDDNCDDDVDENYDRDDDGYVSCKVESEPADCDDNDDHTYPGAKEICDGIDNNCDDELGSNSVSEGDADNDHVIDCDDCSPTDSAVSSEAVEICDGKDNDCDNSIDENVTINYCLDADDDGHGTISVQTTACAQAPTDYVSLCDDCDDGNPLGYPGATEVCNGLDDNCDGTIGTSSIVESDADQDGTPDCADCAINDPARNPDATEVCDGLDNNCDDAVDEGLLITTCTDGDGDGFGDPDTSASVCVGTVGGITECDDCNDDDDASYPGAEEMCDGLDNDCDGELDTSEGSDADGDLAVDCLDCEPLDADISPLESEVCDAIDNDCDGTIDEGVSTSYCPDNDSDGHGDSSNVTTSCSSFIPTGYVTVCDDCADHDATRYGGKSESCNGIDDNCDGTIPDNEKDRDNDGYYGCEGDCSDTNASLYPGAEESCGDGVDQDCSGADLSCNDVDNDGDGYSENQGDCNDSSTSIHPGLIDTCSDEVDNDCDGSSGEDETQSADEEPNDTMNDAIDLGTLDNEGVTCTTLSGQLLGDDDDYFKFYSVDQALSDNWKISAVIEPPAGIIYCVDMVKDSSEVMASDCSTGPEQATAEVEFVIEVATAYYWVHVYAADGSVCAPYSLTVCGF